MAVVDEHPANAGSTRGKEGVVRLFPAGNYPGQQPSPILAYRPSCSFSDDSVFALCFLGLSSVPRSSDEFCLSFFLLFRIRLVHLGGALLPSIHILMGDSAPLSLPVAAADPLVPSCCKNNSPAIPGCGRSQFQRCPRALSVHVLSLRGLGLAQKAVPIVNAGICCCRAVFEQPVRIVVVANRRAAAGLCS